MLQQDEGTDIFPGTSRGIGYSVAEGLAEVGASIIAVYSKPNPVIEERLVSLGPRYNIRTLCQVCKVADAEQVRKLIDQMVSDFGKIDVFVATASISLPKLVIEQNLADYHAQLDVNVHGILYCAKYVRVAFKARFWKYDHYREHMCSCGHSSGRRIYPQYYEGGSLAREWRNFARVNIVASDYVDADMTSDRYNITHNRVCLWTFRATSQLASWLGIVLAYYMPLIQLRLA